MNEKIQQIYDTALVAAGKEKQFETTHLDVAEKFAELILQKCAEIATKQSMHYAEQNKMEQSGAAGTVGHLIFNHFGVEE